MPGFRWCSRVWVFGLYFVALLVLGHANHVGIVELCLHVLLGKGLLV